MWYFILSFLGAFFGSMLSVTIIANFAYKVINNTDAEEYMKYQEDMIHTIKEDKDDE